MEKNDTNDRIMVETNIAQTLDRNSLMEKYDASIKELFADKQILARILKYSLEDFAKEELSVIINSMDEPIVSRQRVEPGHSNLSRIQKTSEEDMVVGEGKIYYDIRFSVYLGDKPIKILINIEAQKSTSPSKLGYHLDNRVIFYLCRMVSAQKEVEFRKSQYDDLKAVRSIWICMDSADDEDSINRIRLTQENVFGKEMNLDHLDKVQGVIIRLRANENVETSKNILIAMLEELLKKESVETKKKKLEEQYHIIMNVETERKVNTMCNLSEALVERTIEQGLALGIEQGIEQGIVQGIEQGIEKKIIDLVCKKINKGYNLEQIADILEEDVAVIQPIYDVAMEQKPNYDIDLILQAVKA